MSDLIRIVDLQVWTHIGLTVEERAQPQMLLVSVALSVDDLGPAGRGDDIRRTIDYADVAASVKKFAGVRARRLLEAFAGELMDELLAGFPARRIQLEIKKFVLPDARHVSVEIERAGRSK
jgi:dihydroneopterin aldolase